MQLVMGGPVELEIYRVVNIIITIVSGGFANV